MVGFFVATGLVVLFYVQVPLVSAATTFVPFGGFEGLTVPNPNVTSSLVCPTYTIVFNSDETNGLPSIFGVFIPPELPFPTYDYNNLITPGTPIIGGVTPVPCPAPLPVYPLFFDPTGPFYLAGTGAF